MKLMHILLPALLAVTTADAKSTLEALTTTSNPGTGGMLPPHFGNGSMENPKGIFRLVAKTFTRFRTDAAMFVPVDSVTYEFSNERNGYTKKDEPNNDETVLFDNSYTYYYNHHKNSYDKKLRRMQTYDAQNNVTSVTYTTYQDSKGWSDSARYLFAYQNGQMTQSGLEIKIGQFWMQQLVSDLSYNNGNIVTLNSPTYKVGFDYSGNKLTSVVDETFKQGVGWQPIAKKLYTYTGDNISAYVNQTWNPSNGNWTNETKWEYVYDAADNMLSKEEFLWSGSNWVSASLHEYTYDADGNKLTDTRKVWSVAANAYVNAAKETSSYNIYGQPLEITTYAWTNGAWGHSDDDYQIRFYYDFPTSVAEHNIPSVTTHIYPVPAKEEVTLHLELGQTQRCHLSIVDMQGRVVKQWDEDASASYHKSVSVADMPSGNYFIRVAGETVQLRERLVVSH